MDSYTRAYEDVDFLNLPELRPVRLQLEMLKPELILRDEGIVSTVVVFGSARTMDPEAAQRHLDAAAAATEAGAGDNGLRELARARRAVEHARYYDAAREFGRIVSREGQKDHIREFVIVTGGGPGIMEAANRGAQDIGARSIGLNITLPHEQSPNPFVTPRLSFQFHYFAIRKLHFMLRAKALVAFPGGFGTFDELFEALTLVQTRKVEPLPVILFGRAFWERAVDFDALVDEGVIADDDRLLFQYAETPQEAWDLIAAFHRGRGSKPASGGNARPAGLE